MKINIIKKENDENIYYKLNGETKKLNFDNIKEISKMFLENKKDGKKIEYDVTTDMPELNLYKTTLENIIKSVCDDEELLELYKENSNQQEEENEEKSSDKKKPSDENSI